MIGIRWNSDSGGPCPNCGQAVVTKTKKLLLVGIPIPLGGPKIKCGCPDGANPGAAQPFPGQPAQAAQPFPGQPMQQQPFPGQPMQQQPFPGQPMQQQPFPGQQQPAPGQQQPFPAQQPQQTAAPPQVAAAPQACSQCGQPLQFSPEHQRSFCGPCQKWY